MASGTCPHAWSLSLCYTPPPTAAPTAPHKHTVHNIPPQHHCHRHDRCNSLWPCGADIPCLPNSRGDRWGEVGLGEWWGRKYWGNRKERRGGGWPLGLFAPYCLSHNPFATQRAGALPSHRIRASHLRRARIELCSVCLGGLLYVKRESIQLSMPPRLPLHSAAVFLHTRFPRPSPNICIGNRAVRIRAGTRLPPKEQQENNSSFYFGSNGCAWWHHPSCIPLLIFCLLECDLKLN